MNRKIEGPISIRNLTDIHVFGDNISNTSRDKSLFIESLKRKTMQEVIERFEWENLPDQLTTDLIERILYFRGKGALFKLNDTPIFLPFALQTKDNSGIDIYGRYKEIIPVLFTGSAESDDRKLLDGKKVWEVVYDKSQEFDPEKSAVILTDSSLQISQDNMPINRVMSPFIEQLTDILVLINIDLVNSAKVHTIIAKDEAQKEAIEREFQNIDRRILEGKRVIVLNSATKLDELVGDRTSKDASRYFQSFQSFDNLRKDVLGIENAGAFLKQEHMTDQETSLNASSGNLVLDNAYRMRREFCELVNHVFGYNINVKIKEVEGGEVVAEEGAHTKQINDGGEE